MLAKSLPVDDCALNEATILYHCDVGKIKINVTKVIVRYQHGLCYIIMRYYCDAGEHESKC